jgi:hypothetical protein
MAKFRFN